MFCPSCGRESNSNNGYCEYCGAEIWTNEQVVPMQSQEQYQPYYPEQQYQEPQYQVQQYQEPQYQQPYTEIREDQLPEKYRPLSAWAYFGLQLLFAVPVIGFIFLIVFSISDGNINRRSFARSYWCAYLILAVFVLIFVFLGAVSIGSLM